MLNRWWTAAVVLFWLATMSWLVAVKVVPPMMIGEPPSYRAIIAQQVEPEVTVAWEMLLNDRRLGWATNTTRRRPDGVTDMDSLVHFQRLPLAEVAPPWLRSLTLPIQEAASLGLDAESNMEIDPLGHLIGFQSAVHLGDVQNVMTIRGTTEAEQLLLHIRSGEFVQESSITLPPGAMVGDGLAPQDRLPNLRVGQTWIEPMYNPLRPPNQPIEVLYAKVERQEPLVWDGRAVRTCVVAYRSDPGGGIDTGQPPQGRAWVRTDGVVLKQEVIVYNSRLTFIRQPSAKPLPPGKVEP